jgi:hypothetical protein
MDCFKSLVEVQLINNFAGIKCGAMNCNDRLTDSELNLFSTDEERLDAMERAGD